MVARAVRELASEIDIVVVEQHPLYRRAVERALRRHRGIGAVHAFARLEEAVPAIRAERPDVVLLDLSATPEAGIALVEELGSTETRVVVLSAERTPAVVYEAIQAGAAGWVTKDLDENGLRHVVLAAANGELVLSRQLQQAVMNHIRELPLNATPKLTCRELEILELVADGYSTPAIAARLSVSPATIKAHLASLYEKLGVSDRAAAVAQGFRRGIID